MNQTYRTLPISFLNLNFDHFYQTITSFASYRYKLQLLHRTVRKEWLMRHCRNEFYFCEFYRCVNVGETLTQLIKAEELYLKLVNESSIQSTKISFISYNSDSAIYTVASALNMIFLRFELVYNASLIGLYEMRFGKSVGSRFSRLFCFPNSQSNCSLGILSMCKNRQITYKLNGFMLSL